MHLTEAELRRLMVPGEGPATLHGHLSECAECRAQLERMRRAEVATVSSIGQPVVQGLPLGADDDTLDVGQRVGRYVLVDRLGAGGMGLVYGAYDPTLARRVAIKVLRRSSGSQAYLLAEAQLLAKLRHPNVVSVHDVGTMPDGRLFMALDHIEGRTAKDWIKSQRPSADQVIALFVQAGRGLAEAHRLGIVHRDFKPENVLVDAEGHAYVLDFGIALAGPRTDEIPAVPGPVEVPSTSDAGDLSTRDGHVKGTPPYLPPEVFTGRRADALSDQFSFCISLYEGLTGVRPFKHTAIGDERWALQPPPEGRALPGWARAAVLRGLSKDPEQRFPSMDALLAALTRKETRRGWLAAAGVALLAVGVGVAIWQRPDPCTVGAQAARAAFPGTARQAARKQFEASGKAWAGETFDLIARSLDEYAGAWGRQYEAVCRSPLAGGELHALQLDCLAQRRATFERLVATLQAATPAVVDRSVKLVSRMPDLEGCADAEALRRSAWVGADPDARRRAEALARELEAIDLDMSGLDQQERYTRAVAAEKEARALNHWAMVARALFVQGHTTPDRKAKVDLRWRSFVAAYSARDYRAQLTVAHDLIVEAFNTGNKPLVQPLIDLCEAAYLAAGEPPALKLELLRLRAAAAFGNAQDAEQPMKDLLDELMRRQDLAALSLRGVTWNNYAVAIGERQERFTEAVAALDKAITAAKIFPKPGFMSFVEFTNFVEYAGSSGQFELALKRADEYRALEAKYPDLPGDVTCQLDLQVANVERYQGHAAASRAQLDRALACAEKLANLDSPFGILFQLTASDVERLEGHLDRALAAAEQSVALALKHTGADSYDTARAQLALAQAHLDVGQPDKAKGALEAVEKFIADVKPSEGGLLVPGAWRTRGAYLVASKGDPAQAKALLGKARTAYEALHHSASVARVDAWLAKVR